MGKCNCILSTVQPISNTTYDIQSLLWFLETWKSNLHGVKRMLQRRMFWFRKLHGWTSGRHLSTEVEVVEKHPNEVWLWYTCLCWTVVKSLLAERTEKNSTWCKSGYTRIIPKWSWYQAQKGYWSTEDATIHAWGALLVLRGHPSMRWEQFRQWIWLTYNKLAKCHLLRFST